MLPDPLHPAVVHFPIVFMFLLPIAAAIALWAIRRGNRPRLAWAVPTGLALALTLSAWLAVETGDPQEERVEHVVGEGALHSHEERAERFLMLSGMLLLVSGALGLAAVGAQVGHTGGKLVYQKGAASAHLPGAPGAGMATGGERIEHDD
jgi:uncharacterized membrane protein